MSSQRNSCEEADKPVQNLAAQAPDRSDGHHKVRVAHSAAEALRELPDRLEVVQHLAGLLDAGAAGGVPCGIFLVDLASFRRINATLGHFAGDYVLNIIAQRLKRLTSGQDLLGRFSGDVFIVARAAVHSIASASALLADIDAAVRQPIDWAGEPLGVVAVIGVALSDGHACAERLFTRADAALIRAKELQLRSQFFDESMSRLAFRRLAIETRLPAALEADRFTVSYQPVVAAETGQVIGVEALARWHDDELGAVAPPAFIRGAESLGLARVLDRRIQEIAIGDRAELARLFNNDELWVSINTSPTQLRTLETINDLERAMTTFGVAPRHVALEVVEDLLLDDVDSAAVVEAARAAGLRIALDDFGTGKGSLAHLLAIDCDHVKIDRSFLVDMLQRKRSRSIIAGLIWMCIDSGLNVIAEGVETKEQLDWLVEYGCQQVQGFYFARPQPISELQRREAAGEALVGPV